MKAAIQNFPKSITDSFIHLLRSLSSDRAIASSKTGSPENTIKSFLFQIPGAALFLKAIQYVLKSPSSSFLLFHLSFSDLSYKAAPMQAVADQVGIPLFYVMQDVHFLLDSVVFLHFSQSTSRRTSESPTTKSN
jgi:hypothetical protein